ncbi:unnamed protein product [Rotaria sp. Silwood2]|nr:unnamed protein product [Rotaria sp. Silwood2]CAF4198045.1 unnamed protein product [Rotaria sp. Silwood2]
MGFTERFPRWITLVIGIVLVVVTAGILGLEIVSNYIDVGHGTIWVGIWGIISGLMGIVIIYFDQLFMNDPCKCYLGDTLCCLVRSVPTFRDNFTGVLQDCSNALTAGTISSKTCPSTPYDKVAYVQAQLACAIAMVITCIVYIVVFLFACFGVCFGHK